MFVMLGFGEWTWKPRLSILNFSSFMWRGRAAAAAEAKVNPSYRLKDN